MCIDICPVGALTSGTYRYQTRPWEMQYVANPCTHCSNGCKTTLSVRNNEILRANNRDASGVNGEFLCGKGRFGFDFTSHAERVRQPLVRRNGKLEAASWEDALEEVARRLKQVRDKHGANAIGVIGSNHTTNEENYLLNRFARATLGTNNLTTTALRITPDSPPRLVRTPVHPSPPWRTSTPHRRFFSSATM